MSDTLAIETHGLSRHFGEIVAVDDLAVTVRAGEVFGFLGHNGAGKTTTVRLLNGILTPTAGNVTVLGLDPFTEGPRLRSQTGVLTETPSLDERLTAREMLRLYGKLYGVPDAQLGSRVTELLETFGLDDRATELVGGYSKGMRQRLALARTLIHEPRLLFFDEPTAGLDPVGRRSVHELITRLSRTGGRTVFLCTHDLAEAQKLCDRVGVMEHGRLVALGTPHALARDLQQGVRLEVVLEAPPPAELQARYHRPAEGREMLWHEEDHVAAVRLLTRDEIPDLVAALVAVGARIYQMTPQEPTLEDVYFALHDRDTADVHLGGQL